MKRAIGTWMLLVTLLTWIHWLPLKAQGTQPPQDRGGIHILKTTAAGSPLEGAVFRIARQVDQQLPHSIFGTDTLTIGEEKIRVVYETFYGDRSMEGKLLQEITTDENGLAAAYGLPYGVYYLVEKTAPQGYNRILFPVRITVNKYSHLTQADGVRDDAGALIDNTIHIINVRYDSPHTGSKSSLRMIMPGIGVVLSCGLLLLMSRKRW